MRSAGGANATKVKEIDMSTNTIDSGAGLEPFQGLEKLNLDHNRLVNLNSFPQISSLKNLSLSYNNLNDIDMTMAAVFTCFPNLEHLNLLKNPCNPMFGASKADYTSFRAKVKNWLPKLMTLDGTDFSKDG